MANSRKNLSPSLKQLGKTSGFGGQKLTTDLVGSMNAGSNRHSLSIGASQQLKSQSGNSREATPIAFGTAHIAKLKPNPGSEWNQLLHQVASGGLSGVMGGGSLLSFGGIKSLISGIEGLFGGGKSTPPPLVAFQLPASQNQTINIGAQNTSNSLQDHSAAVAQAVKTAMLHSSSLNDVIAEI